MADLTDIDGVGPSTAEGFKEAGYETVSDVAEAEPEALAELASRVTEDKALEFVVQAQELAEDDEDEAEPTEDFDLTPAEVSEEVSEEEVEQEIEDLEEDLEEEVKEVEAEEEDEGPDTYSVTLSFHNRTQFDTYHAALMRHHERHYTGNQPVADALEKALDGLDSFSSVEYELTEHELNSVHAAVLQTKTNYQGDNLINHMDELQKVLDQIDEQRREYLF